MQDIKQNMDELFRKAADNYPLKVNRNKWEDIAPALSGKAENKSITKKASSRKYIGLLLLFLFLFISDGIIIHTLGDNKDISFSHSPVESKINNPGIEKREAVNNNKHEKNNLGSKSYLLFQSNVEKTFTVANQKLINTAHEKPMSRFNDQAGSDTATYTFPVIQSNLSVGISKIDSTEAVISATNQEPFPASNKTENVKADPDQKANPEAAKKTNHLARLYIGVMAGPLFDEIKNQGLKKTGFSIGIITGYKFKNHLSVETGFLFAKKPYYSIGRYFKMDKMGGSMPSGMEILSLEGNNFVGEIPVKIKYNFLYRNKNNFFSSAGITSYIMTHEKNDYLVAMNGVQQTMFSSYKNKSRSFAATLDISTGYEHKIGKSNYFRIEPYIQIPLKGMGVGSMQMISTGLRIGITKFTN